MKIDKIVLKEDIKIVAKYALSVFISLFYYELLLHYIVNNDINVSIYNVLFIMSISLLISFFIGFHNRFNNVILVLIVSLISLFYISDLIYFKTFKSLASISMIGNGTNAITNFWWSTVSTIKENTIELFLFELPIILLIIEAIFIKKIKGKYSLVIHPIVLFISVVMWALIVLSLPLGGKEDYTAYGAYYSRFIDTDTASNKLGILPNAIIEIRYIIFGSNRENLIVIEEPEDTFVQIAESVNYNVYDDLDFEYLSSKSEDSQIKNVCDYLNTLQASNKNEHTGEFEGYNLIYICGESFSTMAIDKDITPTLYKLANNGYVLDNYYNSFKNITTNGEYALLTGLWPDIAREETNNGRLTGTMGQSIDNNMSESLGNKFNSIAVNSRAFHNYWGSYYGREETLPNMGFDCMFMGKGMWFTTDWPASDLEMMQQSVDTYINDKQFCAYYMTFSGHGNYSTDNFMVQRNIDYVREKAVGKNYPENLLGYFACNVELDKALEYLMNRLQQAGKLDKTVIVLAGDHYPYYVTDYDYECFNGKISNDYEKYHSTCILYNSAMNNSVHVNQPCCNVDILPTILNLFNIPYDSRLYAGVDIFSYSKHVAMIYDKSFITSDFIYNATNGEVTWLVDRSKMTDSEKQEYVNKYVSYVKGKYAYSISVENTDFYNYIFTNK